MIASKLIKKLEQGRTIIRVDPTEKGCKITYIQVNFKERAVITWSQGSDYDGCQWIKGSGGAMPFDKDGQMILSHILIHPDKYFLVP